MRPTQSHVVAAGRTSRTRTTRKSSTTMTTTTTSLPRQMLFCVVDTPMKQPLPDGLCTVAVLSITHGSFFAIGTNDLLVKWGGHAMDAAVTVYGVDIRTEALATAKQRLLADPIPFEIVWSYNIHSFGVLDTELTPTTQYEAISEVIDVVKIIQGLQSSFRDANKGFSFIGVAPRYKGNKAANLKQHIDRLIRELKPHVVLFRTTDIRNMSISGQYRILGPSPWYDPDAVEQPTFVDSLELKQSVTLPQDTKVLLSLSVAAFRLNCTYPFTFSDVGDQMTCCVDKIPVRNFACQDGADYYYYRHGEHDYQRAHERHLYGGSMGLKDSNVMVIYDSNKTMSRKICNTSLSFQYTGGWAAFDVNVIQDPTWNVNCGSKVPYQGLNPLRKIKEYMGREGHWTDCDANTLSDTNL
ncbi:uncharacterized protein LOC135388220 isoform X2 [Ornithodoros turicata]|uniref:uncharacterized protein LOC135388220 isoform X2 n=1 Tax=Ornithodoros turicata TaxID=34597 RepID=UPI003138C0F8